MIADALFSSPFIISCEKEEGDCPQERRCNERRHPDSQLQDQKNKVDTEGKIVNHNCNSIEEPKYILAKGQTYPTEGL